MQVEDLPAVAVPAGLAQSPSTARAVVVAAAAVEAVAVVLAVGLQS